LGRELGWPDGLSSVTRSPARGLAIRIPGEVTRAKLHIRRKADAIFLDEIRQCFGHRTRRT